MCSGAAEQNNIILSHAPSSRRLCPLRSVSPLKDRLLREQVNFRAAASSRIRPASPPLTRDPRGTTHTALPSFPVLISRTFSHRGPRRALFFFCHSSIENWSLPDCHPEPHDRPWLRPFEAKEERERPIFEQGDREMSVPAEGLEARSAGDERGVLGKFEGEAGDEGGSKRGAARLDESLLGRAKSKMRVRRREEAHGEGKRDEPTTRRASSCRPT